jgi:DNA-binding HxlR family transcriptional regulator
MTDPHNSTECQSRLLPVRDALEVVSGKWKIPLIIALSQGNYRFRELHRQVTGITTRMLSKELKDMEMHGLVTRTVYDSLPVTVEYELTEHGRSLYPVVDALFKWGSTHRDKFIKKTKVKITE